MIGPQPRTSLTNRKTKMGGVGVGKNATWAVDTQSTGCREIGDWRHVGGVEKGGKMRKLLVTRTTEQTTGRNFVYIR